MRIRWRGLELPSRVEADRETLTPTYGKFIVEPFERGYGTTVGNSLRRVLLSSLMGSAVTGIRVEGVKHEFSAIDGVVEDVTEIILNVKSLVVKLEDEGVQTFKLEGSKKGVLTAGMIEAEPSVTIINPDLEMITLSKDVDFSMTMTARTGRGYVTAAENDSEHAPIGFIAVDSVFSPVRRVRYSTEDTRVGQRTNYDRLTLEIWTNGVVTPEMALVEASKIFRKHLNPFVQYFELGTEFQETGGVLETVLGGEAAAGEDDKLNTPVADLNLSVRASNCLQSEGITTVRDLVSRKESELLEVRNFGKTTLAEIKSRLEELGVALAADE
jgi:DNA-directed RNA polymerase subunit alpha